MTKTKRGLSLLLAIALLIIPVEAASKDTLNFGTYNSSTNQLSVASGNNCYFGTKNQYEGFRANKDGTVSVLYHNTNLAGKVQNTVTYWDPNNPLPANGHYGTKITNSLLDANHNPTGFNVEVSPFQEHEYTSTNWAYGKLTNVVYYRTTGNKHITEDYHDDGYGSSWVSGYDLGDPFVSGNVRLIAKQTRYFDHSLANPSTAFDNYNSHDGLKIVEDGSIDPWLQKALSGEIEETYSSGGYSYTRYVIIDTSDIFCGSKGRICSGTLNSTTVTNAANTRSFSLQNIVDKAISDRTVYQGNTAVRTGHCIALTTGPLVLSSNANANFTLKDTRVNYTPKSVNVTCGVKYPKTYSDYNRLYDDATGSHGSAVLNDDYYGTNGFRLLLKSELLQRVKNYGVLTDFDDRVNYYCFRGYIVSSNPGDFGYQTFVDKFGRTYTIRSNSASAYTATTSYPNTIIVPNGNDRPQWNPSSDHPAYRAIPVIVPNGTYEYSCGDQAELTKVYKRNLSASYYCVNDTSGRLGPNVESTQNPEYWTNLKDYKFGVFNITAANEVAPKSPISKIVQVNSSIPYSVPVQYTHHVQSPMPTYSDGVPVSWSDIVFENCTSTATLNSTLGDVEINGGNYSGSPALQSQRL